MANELDKLFSVHQTALRLREQRQGLLASNVANADTPNYKARDINFSAALKAAVKVQATSSQQKISPSASLAATSEKHFAGKSTTSTASLGGVAAQYRSDREGRIDGNNVQVDYERMQFADNAARYEASVTMVTGQIRNMLTVIQNN